MEKEEITGFSAVGGVQVSHIDGGHGW